jgi:hypothetical protein
MYTNSQMFALVKKKYMHQIYMEEQHNISSLSHEHTYSELSMMCGAL